jgi:hypothetical protein
MSEVIEGIVLAGCRVAITGIHIGLNPNAVFDGFRSPNKRSLLILSRPWLTDLILRHQRAPPCASGDVPLGRALADCCLVRIIVGWTWLQPLISAYRTLPVKVAH